MTSQNHQAPRHHRRKTKLAMSAVAAVAALALFAAACGSDDDDADDDPVATTQAPASEATTTTTTAAPDDGLGLGLGEEGGEGGTTTTTMMDPCEAEELEATEIGVTENTIRVLVMADVGSPLAPGLFQGSIDGTNAWAEFVNDNGGLACRQIEVIEHDSQINPTETTNGFLNACEEALALVGSTALFAFNVDDLNTCPDSEGNEIGIPDIPERVVEACPCLLAECFCCNQCRVPL